MTQETNVLFCRSNGSSESNEDTSKLYVPLRLRQFPPSFWQEPNSPRNVPAINRPHIRGSTTPFSAPEPALPTDPVSISPVTSPLVAAPAHHPMNPWITTYPAALNLTRMPVPCTCWTCIRQANLLSSWQGFVGYGSSCSINQQFPSPNAEHHQQPRTLRFMNPSSSSRPTAAATSEACSPCSTCSPRSAASSLVMARYFASHSGNSRFFPYK